MNILEIVKLVATLIAICGGVVGLRKYFSDNHEKELREWQKVIVIKIFRKRELEDHTFDELLAAYRLEAQAFSDVSLPKKEISENALQRILLELVSSQVIEQRINNSYRICVVQDAFNREVFAMRFNEELVKMVGSNPYLYTVDEILKEIAPKLAASDKIPLLHNDLSSAIKSGKFVVDNQGRMAFPQHSRTA